MIVSHQSSAIWQQIPDDIWNRLETILSASPPAQLFFRADDVAIPSHKQNRLLRMFWQHRMPLGCALVPAWLNEARWRAISAEAQHHELFAWHQHGWNHQNHQLSGKKQEFGPDLDCDKKRAAIVRGRDKLQKLLGHHFLPFFTPPWNRVDQETMHILHDEGFLGISRYAGDKLAPIPGLPDIPVNVDLHTRKEPSAETGWQALFNELRTALGTGRAGLMIHHQRMNGAAFEFLDKLLPRLKNHPHIIPTHFGTLI